MMRTQSDAAIGIQAASLAGELLLQLRQAAVTGEATSAALDADALRAAGDRDQIPTFNAIMKLCIILLLLTLAAAEDVPNLRGVAGSP